MNDEKDVESVQCGYLVFHDWYLHIYPYMLHFVEVIEGFEDSIVLIRSWVEGEDSV